MSMHPRKIKNKNSDLPVLSSVLFTALAVVIFFIFYLDYFSVYMIP